MVSQIGHQLESESMARLDVAVRMAGHAQQPKIGPDLALCTDVRVAQSHDGPWLRSHHVDREAVGGVAWLAERLQVRGQISSARCHGDDVVHLQHCVLCPTRPALSTVPGDYSFADHLRQWVPVALLAVVDRPHEPRVPPHPGELIKPSVQVPHVTIVSLSADTRTTWQCHPSLTLPRPPVSPHDDTAQASQCHSSLTLSPVDNCPAGHHPVSSRPLEECHSRMTPTGKYIPEEQQQTLELKYLPKCRTARRATRRIRRPRNPPHRSPPKQAAALAPLGCPRTPRRKAST